MSTIVSSIFTLPTTVIQNGQGVTGWQNPNNILFVDGDFAVSSGSTNILTVGQFNYVTFGNPNPGIPIGSQITDITVRVTGYRGTFNTTLQIYAVDDTSGITFSYPYAPAFQGFSGTNTAYTLTSSLFGTTWTVDQINNLKLKLIADGELHLDAIELSITYVTPDIPTPNPFPTTGETVCAEFVQAQPFQLAQSMAANSTFFYAQSMNYPDGTPILISDFYEDAFIVMDQGTPQEENMMITDIFQNYNGTGLVRVELTTINNRGIMFKYPYTHDINLCVDHSGTAEFVISNSAPFYDRFLKKCQIDALVSAPIATYSEGTLIDPHTHAYDYQGAGVSVAPDGTDPDKMIVTIPGTGINPPTVVSTSSATSGATQVPTLTWSHVSSGINRLLVVQVTAVGGGTVSGITYNGIALTNGVIAANGTIDDEQWYLIAPPVGIYDIIVSLSSNSYITAGAETYTTTNQISPIGATQSATGTSLTPSLVFTTTHDNSLVVDSISTGTLPIVYTAGAGQSENWKITNNPNAAQGASSVQAAGSAPDSVIMAWTITQSIPWVQTVMEINGVSGSASGITSINGDTTPAQTIVGTGGTTVSTVGGVTTVNSSTGGSGITSINGDTTAAQTIVNGGGIGIATVGGVTTLTNLGGSGGGSGNLIKAQTGGSAVSIPGGTLGTQNAIAYEIYLAKSGGATSVESNIIIEYGGQTVAEFFSVTSSVNVFQSGAYIRGYFFANGSTTAQIGQAVISATDIPSGLPQQPFAPVTSGQTSTTVTSTTNQNLTVTITNISGATFVVQSMVVEQLQIGGGSGEIQPFTYGQTLSVNDYVFQATGTEVSVGSNGTQGGATTVIGASTILVGGLFTALPSAQAVGTITMPMFKTGTVTGNLFCKIFALSSGLPTGSALATSNAFNSATLVTSVLTNETFTFGTPFVPTASTEYAFVFDASGVTFSGGSPAIWFEESSFTTGLGHVQSVDSGVTWTSFGSSFLFQIGYVFTAGSVYQIDEANIFNMGPYQGFVQQAGVLGDVKNVCIGDVAKQFTGLTEGGQVYSDQTTTGGITQTLSSTAGRSLGVAISPTAIQMSRMKKISAGVSLSTSPGTFPADGTAVFNMGRGAGINTGVKVSVDNFITDAGVTYPQTVSTGSGAGGEFQNAYLTVPVKAGSGWTYATTFSPGGPISVTFHRTING